MKLHGERGSNNHKTNAQTLTDALWLEMLYSFISKGSGGGCSVAPRYVKNSRSDRWKGGGRQAAKWKGRSWRRLATLLLSGTTILQPDTSSWFVNASLGFQVLSGEVARVAKPYCSIIIVTAERHNANVTGNTRYSTNPLEETAVWTLHIYAEGSDKSHQRFVEVWKLPWKETNMVALTLMQRAFGTLNNMTNKTLGVGCKEKNPTCLEVECRTTLFSGL